MKTTTFLLFLFLVASLPLVAINSLILATLATSLFVSAGTLELDAAIFMVVALVLAGGVRTIWRLLRWTAARANAERQGALRWGMTPGLAQFCGPRQPQQQDDLLIDDDY